VNPIRLCIEDARDDVVHKYNIGIDDIGLEMNVPLETPSPKQ